MREKLRPYQSGIAFVLIAGAFAALLISDLRSTNRVECSLCVDYGGRTECTTGAGKDREDALRSGQTVACAALAGGTNDAFRCSATPPRQVRCQEL